MDKGEEGVYSRKSIMGTEWSITRVITDTQQLSFDPSDANVFGNSLAKIGVQLSALLLDVADSRVSAKCKIIFPQWNINMNF